jgi:hypothetical protein
VLAITTAVPGYGRTVLRTLDKRLLAGWHKHER